MNRDVFESIVTSKEGNNGSICSVIDFHGSVPRKDYPVMFVDAKGSSVGTIGGGTLEYDSIKRAKNMSPGDSPDILEFKLNSTELDDGGGICGGELKVLVEPVSENLLATSRQALDLYDSPDSYSLVLQVKTDSSEPVTRSVVLDKDLSDMIPTEAKMKADFMQATIRKIVAEGMYWIIYPISNSPRLHIFGAGHVGQAIAIQAGLLELDTSVYDDRKELLTAERFPETERINFNSPGEWKEAPFSSRDFVVIASREHRHDRALLEMTLKNPPAYIGLLASTRKWLLMRERLLEDGFSQEKIDKVQSPVGLPINAQTVPEIAVSIIGQIIEHFRNEG